MFKTILGLLDAIIIVFLGIVIVSALVGLIMSAFEVGIQKIKEFFRRKKK